MHQNDCLGFGKKLRERLLRCGLADIYSLEGCSEAEIEEMKIRLRVDYIPQTYREFLKEMGRKAGGLFRGSSYHYYSVLALKDETNDEFERFGVDFRIPEDAIVFLDHGGYAIWYFHTENRDDDPPVYLYEEIKGHARQITDHLSQFYEELITEMAPNCPS